MGPGSRLSGAALSTLCLLFAGAYGQWPLFSSNQNTYFLAGTARSTGGALAGDWLANATDHIPVFTAYVYAVTEWLGTPAFFVAHAILICAYVWSLIRIARETVRPDQAVLATVLTITGLAWMHGDALQRLIRTSARSFGGVGSLVGQQSTALFHHATEGVAGQTILGHFHQPSAFGVLLLVSIALFVTNKRALATACAAIVPWFHASYFLPAGLLTAAYMLVEFRERQPARATKLGALALAVVAPPLVYTALHFAPESAGPAKEAANILVHKRFPHHALPEVWMGPWVVFQLVWVAAGIVAARRLDALRTVMIVPFGAGVVLTGLQVATGSEQLSMLQPWRTSVMLVPLSTGLLVMVGADAALSRVAPTRAKALALVCGLSLLTISVIGVATTLQGKLRKPRPQALINYVQSHCEPGDVYLVPPAWGWFRLATRCPVAVDWKNHPYKDTEVLEWYARVQLAGQIYTNPAQFDAIAALQERARVTHVVTAGELRPEMLWPVAEAESLYRGKDHTVFRIVP